MPEILIKISLIKNVVISESNRGYENPFVKKNRHDHQKTLVKLAMHDHKVLKSIRYPCVITLKRIAPRSFDSDNLVSAFKWIKDAIADNLFPERTIGVNKNGGVCRIYGRADDDKRIEWKYLYEKGPPKTYAIEIHISMEE
jgi:hypothetical protein